MADKSKMTPNKPVKSDREGKKKMVLASKDGKQKLIHYGDTNYKHNYSKEAKDSFRARHNCDDNKDKFSAAYWACKDLWPKNKNNFNCGGVVDGPEVVKGDSIKNDVVKANLSAGEMVIPKTVVQEGPDAIKEFAKEELERVNMNQGGLVQDEFDLGTGLDDEFDLGTGLEDKESTQETISFESSDSAPINPGIERNPSYTNNPVTMTSSEPDDKYNLLETAVAKIAEGGAFGFDDELSGVGEAAGRVVGVKGLGKNIGEQELASPTLSREQLLKAYLEARDLTRKKQSEIQKESPVLSTAFNVAGGLSTGLPSAAAKVASIPAKIAVTGLEGAAIGGTVGLGQSEATNLSDLGSDVLSGAKTGAAIGAGAGTLVTGVGAGLNALKGTQTAEDIVAAYQKGKQGVNIREPEYLTSTRSKLVDKFGESEDLIRARDKAVLNERASVLNSLDPNKQTDVTDILNELSLNTSSKAIPEADLNRIQAVILEAKESGLSKNPVELDRFLRQINDLRDIKVPSAQKAIKQALTTGRERQDLLDPRLTALNREAGEITNVSQVLTKENPLQYADVLTEQGMKESGANLLSRSASSPTAQSFLDRILNKGVQTSTDTGEQVSARSLRELVPDAATKLEEGMSLAKDLDLATRTQRSALTGGNIVQQAANAVNKLGGRIGNAAGMQANKISKDISNLSKRTPEDLNNLGRKFMSVGNKVAQNFGTMLQEAANKPEGVSRDAILFSLMQQPSFKRAYEQIETEDEAN